MASTTVDPSSGEAARPSPRSKRATAATAVPPERVLWRAIVRTGGTYPASRERDRVEWHLAQCLEPHAEGNHCNEGRHLIETGGQPDGHCMVDGRCGRCGETVRHASRKAA
jgi:hypothetical protein